MHKRAMAIATTITITFLVGCDPSIREAVAISAPDEVDAKKELALSLEALEQKPDSLFLRAPAHDGHDSGLMADSLPGV